MTEEEACLQIVNHVAQNPTTRVAIGGEGPERDRRLALFESTAKARGVDISSVTFETMEREPTK